MSRPPPRSSFGPTSSYGTSDRVATQYVVNVRARSALVAAIAAIAAITASPRASATLADAQIDLTEIGPGQFNQPIAMATRPGDSTLYFAEKGGRVKAWNGTTATTILNISGRVSTGGEQGLLGLAFSPGGGRMYVSYTNTAGDTRIKGFMYSNGQVNLGSEFLVLKRRQPFENHNGGNIAFGPDGHLYVALGDGGSAGDPANRAQRTDTLLGKLLRIDPNPQGGYSIPQSNPFVGEAGRDEIWARGLRNPWRFSFDRMTGDLWTADVGQGAWEEVNKEPASSSGGENYGWRRMEGNHSFNGGTPPPGHDPPIYEYANEGPNCAVTGGYVYRGSSIPDLVGAYVFADYCGDQLRAINNEGTGHRLLDEAVNSPASFGEDNNGELYVLSLGGSAFRIDPAA